MRRRRSPEIIAGQVNTDGTVRAGDGFTSVRTGLGQYTLTFTPGFRLVTVVAIPLSGSFVVAVCGNQTATSINVTTYIPSTLATTDQIFNFVAAGVQ